jgi:hypothetical protein
MTLCCWVFFEKGECMDIKNMCCNTFGDRDKIQEHIDELQIELRDQREASLRLFKLLTPKQRQEYNKELISLRGVSIDTLEASGTTLRGFNT